MAIRRKSFAPKYLLDSILQYWRFGVANKYIEDQKIVCDLGCGFDVKSLLFIEDRISGGVGCDLKINKNFKNDKIKLLEFDLNNIFPIKDESVDIVISFAVIEHLDNWDNFLSEAFRILKKDGIIILTTPDPKGKFILETLAFAGLIDKNEIKDHKHYFGKNELFEIFCRKNFRKIEINKFQFGLNNLVLAKK